MADQTSEGAAAKAQIVDYMNANHQASLSYYLQHYSRVPAPLAEEPILRDISFTSMNIQTRNGISHDIPIVPPMASWADARQRTVAMDQEARSALGLSDAIVAEYVLPTKAVHVSVIIGLVFYFCSYAAVETGYLRPGSWYWEEVLRLYPGGPSSYCWFQKLIFWPVVATHVAETIWMDGWKLRKHGVVRGTKLWWMWIISTLIEGYGSHDRFNELVRHKELEGEKKQH